MIFRQVAGIHPEQVTSSSQDTHSIQSTPWDNGEFSLKIKCKYLDCACNKNMGTSQVLWQDLGPSS